MFPKTGVLLITISTAFPVNDLIAGIDVIAVINNTKIKFTLALTECGSNGIEIIPAIGSSKVKKSNKESVIDIWYGSYYLLILQ